MDGLSEREQALLAKIRDLSEERVAEVEDFIDFLRARDEHRDLVQAAASHAVASHWASDSTPQAPAGTTVTMRQAAGLANGADDQEARLARLSQVYEQYVKPVEQDHQGEYAAVTPDGQTLFGTTLVEAAEKSYEICKTGNYLFKVGETSAVGFR